MDYSLKYKKYLKKYLELKAGATRGVGSSRTNRGVGTTQVINQSSDEDENQDDDDDEPMRPYQGPLGRRIEDDKFIVYLGKEWDNIENVELPVLPWIAQRLSSREYDIGKPIKIEKSITPINIKPNTAGFINSANIYSSPPGHFPFVAAQ